MSTTAPAGSTEELLAQLRAMGPKGAFEYVRTELPPARQREVLAALVDALPADVRKSITEGSKQLAEGWRPENDDELDQMFRSELDLRIPRRAVCQGHCAPFDLVADTYFERGNPDKLAIAARGSGKTNNMAGLHWINGRTKAGHESVTAGAVRDQASKAYRYFKVVADRHLALLKKPPLLQETEFKNGSRVAITTGTITGVNSPHPHLAHLDEAELLRAGVYEEALNMAQSSGDWIAQNILTSTWKKVRGLVTKLVDECTEAERQGIEPPYQLYVWCIWETTEPCPHDCSACPFANVQKGTWQDGSPRTFESACKRGSPVEGKGKLKFSDGYGRVQDAVGLFRKLSRRMWEAQRESRRPNPEGLIYAQFDEDEHGVWNWEPDPANGEIFLSVDFGATGGTSVGFWQRMNVSVAYGSRTVPEGALVRFDELFREGVSSTAVGVETNVKLNTYDAEYPGFRNAVRSVFRDPAALQSALDWLDLPAKAPGDPDYYQIATTALPVPVEDGIKEVQELIDRGLFYVDVSRCQNWMEEVGSYERDDNAKPIKEDDHAMDETRYLVWNLKVRNRGGKVQSANREHVPLAAEKKRGVVRGDRGLREWHEGAGAAVWDTPMDSTVVAIRYRPEREMP